MHTLLHGSEHTRFNYPDSTKPGEHQSLHQTQGVSPGAVHLKEQCLRARICQDVDDPRQAVAAFNHLQNTGWLIERHGHQTPRKVYTAWQTEAAA